MNLYHGDCLEILPTFPPASVDAIITDLPYGTTACEWDSIIPLAPMWEQVKRVLKPNGVFITTSSNPFTSVLIMSNINKFRHEWIWEKSLSGSPALCNHAPMKIHETGVVFGYGSITFNPQLTKGRLRMKGISGKSIEGQKFVSSGVNTGIENDDYYPRSIQYFSNGDRINKQHPTQKPVSLYEYLVRTYTNAGETVLDICMGSGTTGVAAIQTGRNFIGIEKEQKYFEIASRRIAQAPQPLFTEPPRQPTQPAPDAGESAPLQADFFTPADSTSQASSTPTQRR